MSIRLPKKGLRIAHLNICSLRNKIHELATILVTNNIHVMAITETHLDENIQDSEVIIQGYNIFRYDRDANGGGSAFYIKEDIPARTRKDLYMKGIEALWLQIQLPHTKHILVCCGYRPPRSDISYLENICTMLQHATESNSEIVFAIDMNVDWLTNCSLKRKLQVAATECNVSQIVNVPTRINVNMDGVRTATCIDHFYTNAPDKCSKVMSVRMGFSDHNLIVMTWKANLPKTGPKIIHKRMYRKFVEKSFLNDLEKVDWNPVLEAYDIDNALDSFTKIFSSACDKHAPIKKITVRKNKAPWLDEEVRKSIKDRDLLKKLAVEEGSMDTWKQYRSLRNKITKMNRQKKKQYYKNKVRECNNDSKKLWNTLNEAMGRDTKAKVPTFIEVNGVFLTKPVDIANYFNNFFITKIKNIRDRMSPINSGLSQTIIRNKIMKGKECNFEFKEITIEEMEKLLMSVRSDKPCGVDHLDGRLIGLAANFIKLPLCHIFNLCIGTGVYPQVWKVAKVTPLPKNSRETFAGANSRPVSILPVVSKLMEKYIGKQIQSYFEINNINTVCQHAYRDGYSTCSALTTLTDNWLSHIDNKFMIGAVLLDFSAAFDVIEHKLLINKLMEYHFNSCAIKLLTSYLSDRKQCVQFNGTVSDMVDVRYGLPQGSCLGPLLYAIFVNDLPYVLSNASMEIYADDTTVWVAGQDKASVNAVLQQEMNLVSSWVNENMLKLNVAKTKSIMLGTSYTLKSKPKINLMVENTIIEQVEEAKLLGVMIDSKLSWTAHIHKVVTKMNNGTAMVRRASTVLPYGSVKMVLQSLVLSCLDYCPQVWSAATKENLNRLQLAQNRAARLALRCPSRTNVNEMHKTLSWMTVDQRLVYSLTTFLFNLYHYGKPPKLALNLRLTNARHAYETRNAVNDHFTLPIPKSEALRRTAVYRAVSQWNKLPPLIIKIDNKWRFKKKVKEVIRCKQP